MWVFRELSRLVPDEEKRMRTVDAKERKNTEKYASVPFGGLYFFFLSLFLDIERVYWKNCRLIVIDAKVLERKIKKQIPSE